MNKQQLLDFLSKAIDEGAGIQITIHGQNQTAVEALAKCQELSNIVGSKPETVDFADSHWYRVWTDKVKLDHFFDSEYMVEDVKFEESGDRIA